MNSLGRNSQAVDSAVGVFFNVLGHTTEADSNDTEHTPKNLREMEADASFNDSGRLTNQVNRIPSSSGAVKRKTATKTGGCNS